jgi:hypothetical protein
VLVVEDKIIQRAMAQVSMQSTNRTLLDSSMDLDWEGVRIKLSMHW